MGIVASQSLKNTIITYTGFLFGAINTLFLYTHFLTDEYYGLVGYMLSLAVVLMPILGFGVQNTLVKFHSTFKTRDSLNSFLTLMLFLPLALILLVSMIIYFGFEDVAYFLSKKNPIIKDYLWHTLIIAIALAYFEVFFAWAKVHMKTVFGNFMKEVFPRIAVMGLLFLLHFKVIDLDGFMRGLVTIYVISMLIMKFYAFSIKFPVITFKKVNDLTRILKYSFLIIIAGSVVSGLLDIDKVMLGKLLPNLSHVAYYNVAIFIATVIAVPQRAMHQILMPLSAKHLNDKDYDALGDLYKRSSLNLLIVGGFVFLLIVLNINQFYMLMPKGYGAGVYVVFLISATKLYDSFSGANNAILFNSDYYRMVLVFGVLLVVLLVSLNIVFIPILGINGAAIATCIAIFIYNTLKLWFVYKKFKISLIDANTFKIIGFIIGLVLLFYFWEFPFQPIINIFLKAVLISLIYPLIVYKFRFSDDITLLVNRILKKN